MKNVANFVFTIKKKNKRILVNCHFIGKVTACSNIYLQGSYSIRQRFRIMFFPHVSSQAIIPSLIFFQLRLETRYLHCSSSEDLNQQIAMITYRQGRQGINYSGSNFLHDSLLDLLKIPNMFFLHWNYFFSFFLGQFKQKRSLLIFSKIDRFRDLNYVRS